MPSFHAVPWHRSCSACCRPEIGLQITDTVLLHSCCISAMQCNSSYWSAVPVDPAVFTREAPDHLFVCPQGQATACTMGCMYAGCVYRVRIRAQNASGWGQYCIPSDVKAAPGVPHAPAAPKAMGQSAVAIELAWEAPQHDGGSEITAYRLEMSQGVVFVPDRHSSDCLPICLGWQGRAVFLTSCGCVCPEFDSQRSLTSCRS